MGGKFHFVGITWNRSKQSHEKRDLTGKSDVLVDVEPKCNKPAQRD